MVNAIDNRFDQALKDYSTELHFLGTNYVDDVNVGKLHVQLEISKVLMKDGEFTCLEKCMTSQIVTICQLLLVNPATSAVGERSFFPAWRLKTWLRSTTSNLTIRNAHKRRTGKLSLIEAANEFAALNQKSNFGTFKESDLKMSG